ncbi:hypothetical protein OG601_37615 [Streptomyces sp. NBC_01239]|nr:hypothetical protein [Streptomyces sp. NBC_01239]MCX4816324.1 hypothetical protein [Streptomyces sp. NBC_01239]
MTFAVTRKSVDVEEGRRLRAGLVPGIRAGGRSARSGAGTRGAVRR